MLEKMNLPNKLTMLRIVLVPLFIILLAIPTDFYEWIKWTNGQSIMAWIAIAVYAVAAITDTLDGQISRKYNIVTKFGKIMDPLADKLLVSAGFIMLTGLGVIPAFVTAIVVFRDFFVNALRMFGSDNGKDVAAKISGKIKTVFQMLTVVLGLGNYALMPTMGIGSFISSSLRMSTFGLLVNVALTVSVIGVVVATVWSFVDYFNRFKGDIDVEN